MARPSSCSSSAGRTVFVAVLLALALVGPVRPKAFFTQQPLAEIPVRAAFLFNFAKFVSWAAADRPVNICIAGNPALTAATADVVRGGVIGGRTVTALSLPASNRFEDCDVLYLADLKADDASAILSRVRGAVLTVGETTRFLRDGGMVRVFIDDNRLRFQVNRRQTDAAGLKISSQLMLLASQ